MLTIPVSSQTFKKGFAGGVGSLEITGSTAFAAALQSNQPFPDGTQDLVVAKVGVQTPELSFGDPNTVACTATVSGSSELDLTVAQPNDPFPIQVDATPSTIPDGRIGVLFKAKAEGKASASGTVKAPAGFSFGLSAAGGGSVYFNRFRLYDKQSAAQTILLDVISDLRLPVDRGTVETLPQPDEIVQFGYDGFLELSAALNWGYSMAATESLKLNEIAATLSYAFKAKAALSMNYRLAGEFAITARAGSKPGWARLQVHKKRDSKRQFAASLDIDAKADVNGLPETADEFLAAILGTDAKTALDVFQKAVKLSDLKEFESTVGKLLSSAVTDLANKWIDPVLDQTNLPRFLAELQKAIDAYNSIDDRIVDAVTHLYEQALGARRAQIEKALGIIRKLTSKEELANVSDPDVWDLVQQMTGGDVFKVVFGAERAGFAELHTIADTVFDLINAPRFDRLRELIDTVKTKLKLDVLFGRLERFSTPDKLKNEADKVLQGLVERIVGRTFDKIAGTELAKSFEELHTTLAKIDTFKNNFYDKLKAALHQSVQARLAYLYTRATVDQALMDLEIDITTAAGQDLFRAAASGRMREAFVKAVAGGAVRVNQALLTHEATKSSQLTFSINGWSGRRLVEVVSKSELSIQAQAGGQVTIFTLESTLKELSEKGRKFKEQMQANLTFRMVAQAFGKPTLGSTQGFLVRGFESMGVEYDLLNTDDLTDPDELAAYLALGEHLRILPAGTLADLNQQFQAGFGKVSAKYVVRFDNKAVQDAFSLETAAIVALAKATARKLVAAQFVKRSERTFKAAIGIAYNASAVAAIVETGGGTEALRKSDLRVHLPASVAGVAGGIDDTIAQASAGPGRMDILTTLFLVEAKLVKELAALDTAIDQIRGTQKPISTDKLQSMVDAVQWAAGQMDGFDGPNTFFAIFDAMVAAGGNGKSHRESALILEITPPGGDKVTKLFMQD